MSNRSSGFGIGLVVVLLATALCTGQMVHYGDQAPAAGVSSTSQDAGGHSWMITVRSPGLIEPTVAGIFTSIVKPVADGVGFCSMSVFYGYNRARIALVCPAKPTVKDAVLRALSAVFGADAVSTTANIPIRVHGRRLSTVTTSTAPVLARISSLTVTNVPWNLDRVDSRPLSYDNAYTYDNDGSAVDIYIVDTGITVTHTEFGGRAQWLNNTVDAIDQDCAGHGTHVAGIAGGRNYGVAKGVNLFAVKVLDCKGDGTIFTVMAGLEIVISRKVTSTRRTIVNLSLNADKSAELDAVVDELVTLYDVAVVVAAGNSHMDASTTSPAGASQVIAVAATDTADRLASFSNFGASVRVAAPGVGILSSFGLGGDTSTAVYDGTSQASPHFSGGLALYWQSLAPNTSAVAAMQSFLQWATPNVIPNWPGPSVPPLVYTRVVDTVEQPLASPVTPIKPPSRPRLPPQQPLDLHAWTGLSKLPLQSAHSRPTYISMLLLLNSFMCFIYC